MESGSINLTWIRERTEFGFASDAQVILLKQMYNDGLPIELFDNGGVVPSLDTEANQNCTDKWFYRFNRLLWWL